jgi:DNA-binding SARP family transcriptional activator
MVDFRILGPLEVLAGGRRLKIGGPLVRRILATLLLNPDRVVEFSRLVEAGWGETPPATARRQVQNRVGDLRAVMDSAGGAGIIASRESGYLLRLGAHRLDALAFEELLHRARVAADGGDLEAAVDDLRRALALWRGPLLAGLDGALLETARASMDEKRLAAIEDRVDLELALGRQREVVAELRSLVARHPLRERLVGQLMLALYREGRRDEALTAYRQLADRLAGDLGVDPGTDVRLRYEAILGEDPALDLPVGAGSGRGGGPPVIRPAQLPADVPAFTGRDGDLARLDGAVTGGTVVISAISGSGGVGKTALAVHWGHRAQERFPDGQLYVNLRGYASTPPVRPIDALAAFLRALGVPGEQVPAELDQAVAMYRAMLADRRVLVVLDNAANADQVLPLVGGGPGCQVLITSRDALTDLVTERGAYRLSLDVLAEEEAHELLVRVLGGDRVAAEPWAVAELARLCARLPLALRIAAANLSEQPERTIADYTAALESGNRLAALTVEGDEQAAVRAAFSLSYEALPSDARRMFRLLGLVPGADVTAPTAAALAGTTTGDARRVLGHLAAVHLAERHSGREDRYAFHDLLRLYAVERTLGEDPEADRRAATDRLYRYDLRMVDAAARLLYPEKLRVPVPAPDGAVAFVDDKDALAWLDAERGNLVAAVVHAAEDGPRRAAYLIADALRGYFSMVIHLTEWQALATAGLAAARADGDLHGQAAARLSLAGASRVRSQYHESIEHYTQASMLSRQAGWSEGEATALGNAGTAYWGLGQLAAAADHFSRAAAILHEAGQYAFEAVHLGNLTSVYQDMGRLAEAAESQRNALALERELGHRGNEATALVVLGATYHLLGRLDEAADLVTRALPVLRELGNRPYEVDTLRTLAELHLDAGRDESADELARTALSLAEDLGMLRFQADALNTIGTVHRRHGRYDEAAADHERALRLARDTGDRLVEAASLIGLAATHLLRGEPDDARQRARDALAIAREDSFRVLEGRATAALAAIDLAAGRYADSIRLARDALAIQRGTGYRLGEAEALLTLGRALLKAGQDRAGLDHLRQALAVFTEIGTSQAEQVRALLREYGGE